MFQVTPNGHNRLDIEVNGKLDRDTMTIALDQLNEKSRDIEHGLMLYQMTDFQFPALSAIGTKLTRLPQLFKLIRRFDFVAVVSDKTWIRKAGEIEGLLIPGVTIKSFAVEDREQAEHWLHSQ